MRFFEKWWAIEASRLQMLIDYWYVYLGIIAIVIVIQIYANRPRKKRKGR